MSPVGRTLLWPIRRFFDPRFSGLARQIDVSHEGLEGKSNQLGQSLNEIRESAARESREVRELLTTQSEETRLLISELRQLTAAGIDAGTEATTLIGRSSADVLEESQRVAEEITALQQLSERILRRVGRLTPVSETGTDEWSVAEVDDDLARVLNFAGSHLGFAAQCRLWLNNPVSLEYGPGTVKVRNVNERIAEIPYVFRALAPLARGARILDVGAAESVVALSLASLGFAVTALDPRGYPFAHPNLDVIEAPIEEFADERTYAGVVCLSTIEHIGLDTYGQDSENRGDLAAMSRVRDLTDVGGLLVLTAPFGKAGAGETARTYDRKGLARLLAGWDVEDFTLLQRQDDQIWASRSESTRPTRGDEAVAMITARRAA